MPTPTLADRLKKASSGSKVDLNPAPRERAPKKEIEVLPELETLLDDDNIRRSIETLCQAHSDYGQQEREAKRLKKPITDKIKELAKKYQIFGAMVEGKRLKFYNAPRTSLSESLLIAAGVSPSIINKCKVSTDAWTLRVSLPGQDDED